MSALEKQNLYIQRLKENDSLPIDLLLLADEVEEVIMQYIHQCTIYIVRLKNRSTPVGVFALYHLNNLQLEIKNMAVAEDCQGQGIGTFMIQCIKEIALKEKYLYILVGTADAAYMEIAFYKKNSFVEIGRKENFFVANYPKPLYDNGQRLKDMIMFHLKVNQ